MAHKKYYRSTQEINGVEAGSLWYKGEYGMMTLEDADRHVTQFFEPELFRRTKIPTEERIRLRKNS